ncbi:hypothetical protein HNR42_001560 [Deinobacterium chartae]|uniref:Uncharacterized protein n=1 Tax=Deinobacterium chartae TaxID=521158 RepID=A0A841I2J0_9DEIO|nr:hypothetical protein [Deinobacterium chartae]MBB6098135.1 hypothetical protein [Deinobacterium chartae]
MKTARSARPAPKPASKPAAERTYAAGCGRTWSFQASDPDLAYTALEFPECPTCMHRVEPEGAAPFCTLRPQGTPNPFAALAALNLPDE